MTLRERKKAATRQAIREAALQLFAERGFAEVSVNDIADKAGVSRMTVFNYFPTKEDIVVAPLEEELEEIPAFLRECAAGEPLVAAARRHFLERLAAHAPETGLDDGPEYRRVLDLIRATPSLMARVMMFQVRVEQALARALEEITPGDPRVPYVAGQLHSLFRTLAQHNTALIYKGMSAEEAYPQAVEAARIGFGLLERGLGGYPA
ncbi:TetR family transcriptional regulator [Thermoactinospora rubra]|uniref:TetR family transcriptional regulator n=1 Tax=Thermoactinospora rubra TaxID=1088767 RepID=UPI000A110CB2|nr:TetR family transcriptional regulator [Thermoactinospora rubra]